MRILFGITALIIVITGCGKSESTLTKKEINQQNVNIAIAQCGDTAEALNLAEDQIKKYCSISSNTVVESRYVTVSPYSPTQGSNKTWNDTVFTYSSDTCLFNATVLFSGSSYAFNCILYYIKQDNSFKTIRVSRTMNDAEKIYYKNDKLLKKIDSFY